MNTAYVLIGLMLVQLVLFCYATGYQLYIWSKKHHPSHYHKRDICSGIGFLLMYVEAMMIQWLTPHNLGDLWIASAVFGVIGMMLLAFGLKQRKALYSKGKR